MPAGVTIDPSATVTIQKLSSKVTLYSVNVTDNSAILGFSFPHAHRITVDQNGLAAGDQTVLFSQLQVGPSNDQGIASALQNLAPSGVTIGGTEDVRVRTFNGVTTYAVTVDSGTGTSTTITVDSSGVGVTPSTPSATTTTFGAAPGAVQAGLNAIAPSGTTIDSSQTVYVLTLGGISYYSLNLSTDVSIWGFGRSWGERITVDQNGLPSGNQQITYGQLSNGPANDKAIGTALRVSAERCDDCGDAECAGADGGWHDDVYRGFDQRERDDDGDHGGQQWHCCDAAGWRGRWTWCLRGIRRRRGRVRASRVWRGIFRRGVSWVWASLMRH